MDIKLNARLSAYSKIDAIEIPEYKHELVTQEQIDSLFAGMDQPTSVTKSEIDQLFEETDEPSAVLKSEIDLLFAQEQAISNAENIAVTSVSYSDIDSLFNR